MNIKEHVSGLKDYFVTQLTRSSCEYLESGLRLFHEYRDSEGYNDQDVAIERLLRQPLMFYGDYRHPQTAYGNLAISIELMLKAIIAKKHLALLFVGLDPQATALLLCPEELDASASWQKLYTDIRSAECKTIDFENSATIFFMFYPDFKQELDPHLKSLIRSRNASVHFVLPSFRNYDLERAAYVALRIEEILSGGRNDASSKRMLDFLNPTGYIFSEKDKLFMEQFQKDKSRRVAASVQKAQEKAKTLGSAITSPIVNDWEHFAIHCPICLNSSIASGYTDVDVRQVGYDNDMMQSLLFFATGFACRSCGLTLKDSDELRLAGIELYFDRSDELDDFLSEGMQEEKNGI